MGLKLHQQDTAGDTFSEDILTVEIQGPREDPLTIIDVPGIFRDISEGTSEHDMEMVKDMVRRYIKDDRTIILAVLPANVDIATQEILRLAEEYDKDGDRTLGVLTKPDLVLEPSAQAKVCELVQGKRRPLTLGYYLVRNRGEDDEVAQQSEIEKAFRKQPWRDLPKDRVGAFALKQQLQFLLKDVTTREFSELETDVKRKLRECNEELKNLGPSRSNRWDRNKFLSPIAGQFQELVRAALAADYNANAIFDKEELRLVTQVINLTDVFSSDFHRDGHARRFEARGGLLKAVTPLANPNVPPGAEHIEWEEEPASAGLSPSKNTIETIRQLVQKAGLDDFTPQEETELGDIVTFETEIKRPSGCVSDWINDVYLRCRGQDLGTFNSRLISSAFAEQSRKWEPSTKRYVSKVILTIHRFIYNVISYVCPDTATFRGIWDGILDSLREAYKEAMAQVDLLIHVSQRKQPWTLNQRFNQDLAKARANRLASLLQTWAWKDKVKRGETQHTVNLRDINQAIEAQSNVEYLQKEIHDILYAYYDLAVDRYLDNIFQLAVDYLLLNGPNSPLKVFSPEWVWELDPNSLEKIAGESKSAKRNRSRVRKKLSDMEEALKILK